ncbi:chaperonin-like RbcX protein 2, chloroplastic [Silene latifolia]|uniref:chaperonin-like RbcX protein 2, chloroplastic n=1 Tax=Silene latifolia TaxID=37657 RepID=UPI003D76E631
MLGAVSLLGSTPMNLKECNKKQSSTQMFGSLELNSLFDHQMKKLWYVKNKRCSKKQPKIWRHVIVNIGGQYEESFEDVKTQLLNYFTQKAVRTVMTQLYEMNPTQYTWLYNFLVTNKPEDGKLFIRNLGKENQDLAERVMVTRLHLYGRWIKKCDHGEIYKYISDENLELMRERLLDTIVWPSDDTNTDKIG